MHVTLHELLQPQVIVETISKISVGRGALSQIFGWQLGSGSVKKVPTRYASFRIFNKVREVATFTAPGTGPNVIPPNPMGEQRVAMARMHEKLILDAEQLGNLSPISGPNQQVDQGGQDYIKHMETYMAERFNGAVEMMTAGFIRGILYLEKSGHQYIPKLTAPSSDYISVDFGVPSGNKTQLDMLGSGSIIDVSWANPAANIVGHCLDIRAAMVQLTGMPLACVMLNSSTWKNVINNTSVRTVGGTVQAPFDSFTYEEGKDALGNPLAGVGMAKLRAIPFIDWYIIDDVLSVGGSDPVYSTGDGSLTKVVPDNVAVFMPKIDTSWCQMWQGGEYISEDVGKPWVRKEGFSAWKSYSIEPTALSLVALLNALPVPYREKAWAYGTVQF